MRQAWYLALPVLFIAGMVQTKDAVAREDALTFATTEYSSDWNPVSTPTYPSVIATDLVSERLIRRTCLGGDAVAAQSFENECLVPAAAVSKRGSVLLRLNPTCAAGQRPLNKDDVIYTLLETTETPSNRYHQYALKVDGAGRLRISRPSNPPRWLAKEILGFPLLREPTAKMRELFGLANQAGSLARHTFISGDESLINDVTGGMFAYENILNHTVRLKLRDKNKSTGNEKISRININVVDRMVDLTEMMRSRVRPDIVLSVSHHINPSDSLYTKRFDPNLNSFTYFGFNFATRDLRQRRLFEDAEFRRLFTTSIWTLRSIRRILDFVPGGRPKGTFIGQSPDVASPRPQDSPAVSQRKQIQKKVRDYARRTFGERGIVLKVILAPRVAGVLFDAADLKLLDQELNAIWSLPNRKGIRFRFTDPTAGPAHFKEARRSGDFHLVFDTFEFGANRLRYIAFTDPESPLNDLGINIFPASKVETWMKGGNKGRLDYFDNVMSQYPYAVVGHFPRRVLISTNFERYNGNCPSGARAPLLHKIWMWERKAPR